jgi:protein-tyrosine phosphatase
MVLLLNWQNASEQRAIVRQAAETLARGGTVVFPTEAVYTIAASVLHPAAVERVGQATNGPLAVAVRGRAEALDWAPTMSELGRRLARRCWPGPVTLLFDGADAGVASRLTESMRQRLCPRDQVRLRVPAHEALQWVQSALQGPLVLSGAHNEGSAPAVTAVQAAENLNGAADLILDDGPSHYGQTTTVVQVNGQSWSVLCPGAMSEADLRRQTAFLLVFVCTGNTCRSPMAEALCKRLLAERLGCAPTQLAERGFLVLSAGLAAMMGGAAAAEAVEAVQELGADLAGHRSRALSRDLATQADCIVAMTRSHLLALAYQYPDSLERCRLLRADGADIGDPLGSDREVYRRCAADIAEHLAPLVVEWTQTQMPNTV